MRSYAQALRTIAALASAPALALGLAAPLSAQTLETGPIKVTDSGSITPSGYALKGVTGTANNSGLFGYGTVASSAINIDGVVGYVQTQQSVGVVGWAQSTGTAAYGIYGYSATGPGVYGFNNNGAEPGVLGSDTSSGGGTAVEGTSTNGVGLVAVSGAEHGVYGTTSTSSTDWGGVVGFDFASVAGNFGVAGESNLGSGVAAFNFGTTSGDALYAYTNGGIDTIDSYNYGSSEIGNFFYDDASLADGYFEVNNGTFALDAYNEASGAAFTAGEMGGEGAEAYGQSGGAGSPVLGAEEGTSGMYSFATYNLTSANLGGPGANNESFIISDTVNYSGNAYYDGTDANVSGDLYVAGNIYTDCEQANNFPETQGSDCVNGPYVKRTSAGTKVTTYAATQSLPTIEDFGTAHLVNGQANVTLERTFASTIDATREYLVFVTPEGDCHGLYIASKSSGGFVVRELMGGHSSIAFQYRIVGHPYGDTSERLAAVHSKRAFGPRGSVKLIGNPHSAVFKSIIAKGNALRAAAIHQRIKPARLPQRPAQPNVRAILSASR